MKFVTGVYLWQYLASVTGCLSIMAAGMHYGWAAPTLPVLQSEDSPFSSISSEEGALAITMQEYGNIFGDIVGAYIGDKFGRKRSMLWTTPLILLSWFLIAPYVSFDLVLAGRFIGGFVGGIDFTVLPMYLGEISHPSIRGGLSSLLQLSYNFGQFFFNIFGSLISIQAAVYMACFIPIIQMITFAFMPESPYYFIIKQNYEDAKKSLQKLNQNCEINNTLNNIAKTNNNEKVSKFELITDPASRKAVLITFGLRFFQHFTGITAINNYVKQIFIEVDTGISPSIISIVYFFLQFTMCFLNSALVDKIGRKPLLYFSLLGTGLTNATLSIYFYLDNSLDLSKSSFKYIPVFTILLYVIIFNIGMSATTAVYFAECFNTRVKALALCTGDIFFSLIIITVAIFFQYTKDNIGLYVPFLTFSISCTLGLFFVYFVVPETKGMTLEEIQLLLRKEKIETSKDLKNNV